MAKKEYGIMPAFPKLVAMMRGSSYRYFVFGIDWWNRHIIVLKDGHPTLVPIEQVKFVEPKAEEIEMLSEMARQDGQN